MLIVFFGFSACEKAPEKNTAPKARKAPTNLIKKTVETNDKKRLSDYGFFKGELANLSPNEKVYSYSINTPIFKLCEKAALFICPRGRKWH